MRAIMIIMLMAMSLYSWTFTEKDFETMNDRQLEVYHMAKEIGYKYGLGDTLIKIAAVETRLGLIKDRKNAKHCGPMQISTYYSKMSCEALNDNLYLSMEYAAKEILNWQRISKGSMDMAIKRYNAGHMETSHGVVYLARINKVGNTIDKSQELLASLDRPKEITMVAINQDKTPKLSMDDMVAGLLATLQIPMDISIADNEPNGLAMYSRDVLARMTI